MAPTNANQIVFDIESGRGSPPKNLDKVPLLLVDEDEEDNST